MKRLLFLIFISLFSINAYSQADEPADTTVYSMVTEMPMFPGGKEAMHKYILKNVKYPKKAKKEAIYGKVYVNFVILPTGKIGKVWVAKGIREEFDKEAIRVIKGLPEFMPGKRKGKPVNVRYTLAVPFYPPGQKPKDGPTAPLPPTPPSNSATE